MLEMQRTIEKPVSISGTGLHTGHSCNMTFYPAPTNYGIRFIRIDLPDKPEIPANADYVVDISRGTTLGIGEVKVHTVEHVLSAIVGLQIDNLRIEIDGIEPPVADGSSIHFVEKLQKAGFVSQDEPKDYLVITEPVSYKDEARQVEIVALPLNSYRITAMVDYQNPALGSQHSGMFDLEKEYVSEFASARTFCFLSEVEALADSGLIKGGNLENAVCIVDHPIDDDGLKDLKEKLKLKDDLTIGENGFLNGKTLRYKNEPVRHKVLDLIGDLALIGTPIKAQILAARPGHKANVEFAKIIRKLYHQKKLEKRFQHVKKEGIVFDINAILKILPHRYPFVLVDKIVHHEMGKKVIGIKNVTINEPFFQGHFPGQPVMPGVLQIEAMAQVGGILTLGSIKDPSTKLVLFMTINNVKFRKQVIPGDQLVIEVEQTAQKRNIVFMNAKAYVDNQLVSEGEFTAAIVDKMQNDNN